MTAAIKSNNNLNNSQHRKNTALKQSSSSSSPKTTTINPPTTSPSSTLVVPPPKPVLVRSLSWPPLYLQSDGTKLKKRQPDDEEEEEDEDEWVDTFDLDAGLTRLKDVDKKNKKKKKNDFTIKAFGTKTRSSRPGHSKRRRRGPEEEDDDDETTRSVVSSSTVTGRHKGAADLAAAAKALEGTAAFGQASMGSGFDPLSTPSTEIPPFFLTTPSFLGNSSHHRRSNLSSHSRSMSKSSHSRHRRGPSPVGHLAKATRSLHGPRTGLGGSSHSRTSLSSSLRSPSTARRGLYKKASSSVDGSSYNYNPAPPKASGMLDIPCPPHISNLQQRSSSVPARRPTDSAFLQPVLKPEQIPPERQTTASTAATTNTSSSEVSKKKKESNRSLQEYFVQQQESINNMELDVGDSSSSSYDENQFGSRGGPKSRRKGVADGGGQGEEESPYPGVSKWLRGSASYAHPTDISASSSQFDILVHNLRQEHLEMQRQPDSLLGDEEAAATGGKELDESKNSGSHNKKKKKKKATTSIAGSIATEATETQYDYLLAADGGANDPLQVKKDNSVSLREYIERHQEDEGPILPNDVLDAFRQVREGKHTTSSGGKKKKKKKKSIASSSMAESIVTTSVMGKKSVASMDKSIITTSVATPTIQSEPAVVAATKTTSSGGKKKKKKRNGKQDSVADAEAAAAALAATTSSHALRGEAMALMSETRRSLRNLVNGGGGEEDEDMEDDEEDYVLEDDDEEDFGAPTAEEEEEEPAVVTPEEHEDELVHESPPVREQSEEQQQAPGEEEQVVVSKPRRRKSKDPLMAGLGKGSSSSRSSTTTPPTPSQRAPQDSSPPPPVPRRIASMPARTPPPLTTGIVEPPGSQTVVGSEASSHSRHASSHSRSAAVSPHPHHMTAPHPHHRPPPPPGASSWEEEELEQEVRQSDDSSLERKIFQARKWKQARREKREADRKEVEESPWTFAAPEDDLQKSPWTTPQATSLSLHTTADTIHTAATSTSTASTASTKENSLRGSQRSGRSYMSADTEKFDNTSGGDAKLLSSSSTEGMRKQRNSIGKFLVPAPLADEVHTYLKRAKSLPMRRGGPGAEEDDVDQPGDGGGISRHYHYPHPDDQGESAYADAEDEIVELRGGDDDQEDPSETSSDLMPTSQETNEATVEQAHPSSQASSQTSSQSRGMAAPPDVPLGKTRRPAMTMSTNDQVEMAHWRNQTATEPTPSRPKSRSSSMPMGSTMVMDNNDNIEQFEQQRRRADSNDNPDQLRQLDDSQRASRSRSEHKRRSNGSNHNKTRMHSTSPQAGLHSDSLQDRSGREGQRLRRSRSSSPSLLIKKTSKKKKEPRGTPSDDDDGSNENRELGYAPVPKSVCSAFTDEDEDAEETRREQSHRSQTRSYAGREGVMRSRSRTPDMERLTPDPGGIRRSPTNDLSVLPEQRSLTPVNTESEDRRWEGRQALRESFLTSTNSRSAKSMMTQDSNQSSHNSYLQVVFGVDGAVSRRAPRKSRREGISPLNARLALEKQLRLRDSPLLEADEIAEGLSRSLSPSKSRSSSVPPQGRSFTSPLHPVEERRPSRKPSKNRSESVSPQKLRHEGAKISSRNKLKGHSSSPQLFEIGKKAPKKARSSSKDQDLYHSSSSGRRKASRKSRSTTTPLGDANQQQQRSHSSSRGQMTLESPRSPHDRRSRSDHQRTLPRPSSRVGLESPRSPHERRSRSEHQRSAARLKPRPSSRSGHQPLETSRKSHERRSRSEHQRSSSRLLQHPSSPEKKSSRKARNGSMGHGDNGQSSKRSNMDLKGRMSGSFVSSRRDGQSNKPLAVFGGTATESPRSPHSRLVAESEVFHPSSAPTKSRMMLGETLGGASSSAALHRELDQIATSSSAHGAPMSPSTARTNSISSSTMTRASSAPRSSSRGTLGNALYSLQQELQPNGNIGDHQFSQSYTLSRKLSGGTEGRRSRIHGVSPTDFSSPVQQDRPSLLKSRNPVAANLESPTGEYKNRAGSHHHHLHQAPESADGGRRRWRMHVEEDETHRTIMETIHAMAVDGEYTSPYYRSRLEHPSSATEASKARQSLRAALSVADRKSRQRRSESNVVIANPNSNNNASATDIYATSALNLHSSWPSSSKAVTWPEISVPTNPETWDAVSRLTADDSLFWSRNSSNRSILSSIECPRLDLDDTPPAAAGAAAQEVEDIVEGDEGEEESETDDDQDDHNNGDDNNNNMMSNSGSNKSKKKQKRSKSKKPRKDAFDDSLLTKKERNKKLREGSPKSVTDVLKQDTMAGARKLPPAVHEEEDVDDGYNADRDQKA